MISSTSNVQKEGETELTPAVIESAALEIIQSARDVLEMYGIKGAVTNIGLGLIPVHGKVRPLESQGYELSFSEHDEFGFAVEYKKPKE